MNLLQKTALGLVVAATALGGLTATPAAAHDRGYDGNYGYYDRDYRDYRHDGYRDGRWDRRDEWRWRQRHHRHRDWRDRDRYDNDWRYDDRRDRRDRGWGY